MNVLVIFAFVKLNVYYSVLFLSVCLGLHSEDFLCNYPGVKSLMENNLLSS